MSWNPPSPGSGAWPGDPGQPPPGYIPPPAPGQGGGQPQEPGVPVPQWYGMPGQGGYQPPGRRHRAFRRLGIRGAVVIGVIIVSSLVAYVHGRHTWKLTAPGAAAGMPRDTSPLDTLGLSAVAAGARSAITSVSGYGTLKSSVSAAYQRGPGPLVWFAGFNGTFDRQLVLDRYQGARVVNVDAGPHGGVAECARSTSATLCQWSTTTTVGQVIIRTSALGGPVPIASADSLMIKVRDSVEQPG